MVSPQTFPLVHSLVKWNSSPTAHWQYPGGAAPSTNFEHVAFKFILLQGRQHHSTARRNASRPTVATSPGRWTRHRSTCYDHPGRWEVAHNLPCNFSSPAPKTWTEADYTKDWISLFNQFGKAQDYRQNCSSTLGISTATGATTTLNPGTSVSTPATHDTGTHNSTAATLGTSTTSTLTTYVLAGSAATPGA